MADLTIVATGSLPVNTSRRLSLTTGLVVLVLHALVVAFIVGNQPTNLGPAHHLGNGHADGLAGHGLLPDRRIDDEHYFKLRDRPEFDHWFARLAAFDVIANNAERKAGHVLYDGSRCWAIDNGLCLHNQNKLRTVIWEYAGLALEPSWNQTRTRPPTRTATGRPTRGPSSDDWSIE